MKLSDIKGERTLDVIADIIVPVANIAEDPRAARLFQREELPAGLTPREFAIQRLKASIPALVRDHKHDILTIMSTLAGVPYEEYSENINIVKLMADLVDLVSDEAFTMFFISAQSES